MRRQVPTPCTHSQTVAPLNDVLCCSCGLSDGRLSVDLGYSRRIVPWLVQPLLTVVDEVLEVPGHRIPRHDCLRGNSIATSTLMNKEPLLQLQNTDQTRGECSDPKDFTAII